MGIEHPESHDVTRGAPNQAPVEQWSQIFRQMTAGQRDTYEKIFDEAAEPGTQDARFEEDLDTIDPSDRHTPWNYFDSAERFQSGVIALNHRDEMIIIDREGFIAIALPRNEEERGGLRKYLQDLPPSKTAIDIQQDVRLISARAYLKQIQQTPPSFE